MYTVIFNPIIITWYTLYTTINCTPFYFPIWWYVAPTIINTFLESYDLTGKTVIPFATSGGSDIGKTNERLAPSCKGAKLMDGKVFKGCVGHQELAAWVEGLGL